MHDIRLGSCFVSASQGGSSRSGPTEEESEEEEEQLLINSISSGVPSSLLPLCGKVIESN